MEVSPSPDDGEGRAAAGGGTAANTQATAGTATSAGLSSVSAGAASGGFPPPQDAGPHDSGYVTQDDEMASQGDAARRRASEVRGAEGAADQYLSADTPAESVAAFTWAVLRRILPAPLLGGARMPHATPSPGLALRSGGSLRFGPGARSARRLTQTPTTNASPAQTPRR